MARSTSPDCKQCRREGVKLFLKGERCLTKCSFDKRPVAPGPHTNTRKKVSEYGMQLREKQKVRRAYGLLEKQFRLYYEKATKSKEGTGWALLKMLELRLDNVVYRLGLGSSRTEARQIVNHGHITVNGKKVNIPSYQVNPGDVIAVKEQSKDHKAILEALEKINKTVEYVEFDKKKLSGTYVRMPERSELPADIKESMIVEFYNK